MWVADTEDDKLYAYSVSDGTRDAARDIALESYNDDPQGIWSDGATMWVADTGDDKLYAYNMPPSGDATLSALSVFPKDITGFARGRTSYEVGVDSSVTQATVLADANHAAASVSFDPVDADDVATGHQVNLSPGRNLVTVTVTAENGSKKDYTVSVNRGVTDATGWHAEADLDGLRAAGNNYPYGIWSDGTTVWVGDSYDNKLYAYRLSDGAREADRDIDIARRNDGPSGIWSDGTTMWVADVADNKLYAYRLSDGTRDSDREFFTGLAPDGIWSDGTTIWVVSRRALTAYRLSDRLRDADRDITTLAAAGNQSPTGIWSDGGTVRVADVGDRKVYAYRLSDGSRDADRDYDFDTLTESGNGDPQDLWSDGTTIWVVDRTDAKVYAYNMPLGVSFGQSTYTVDEGGTLEVSVTLSFVPDRTVTIPLTATDQNGASTDDYGVPAEVTFNKGETTQTITFTAEADDEDDDGESVKLGFGTLPDGVARGIIDEATVDIDDVPSVEVSFGSATYSVQESDDTTTTDITENEVTVTVTLSADPERSVTIPITAAGQDGAADADYSGVPTSVTFVSGDTEETFTFTATHDTVDDDGGVGEADLRQQPCPTT